MSACQQLLDPFSLLNCHCNTLFTGLKFGPNALPVLGSTLMFCVGLLFGGGGTRTGQLSDLGCNSLVVKCDIKHLFQVCRLRLCFSGFVVAVLQSFLLLAIKQKGEE